MKKHMKHLLSFLVVIAMVLSFGNLILASDDSAEGGDGVVQENPEEPETPEEPGEGGGDEEPEPDEGGGDEEPDPDEGGGDEEPEPDEGGGDEEPDPDEGGGDEEPEPEEGGGDEESDPDEGGGDEEPEPDEGGGDEEPDPDEGGGDEEPEPDEGGGDEEPEPDEGGGDEEPDPDEGGGDEEPEPDEGGGDEEPDPDEGGGDEVPEPDEQPEEPEESEELEESEKPATDEKPEVEEPSKQQEVAEIIYTPDPVLVEKTRQEQKANADHAREMQRKENYKYVAKNPVTGMYEVKSNGITVQYDQAAFFAPPQFEVIQQKLTLMGIDEAFVLKMNFKIDGKIVEPTSLSIATLGEEYQDYTPYALCVFEDVVYLQKVESQINENGQISYKFNNTTPTIWILGDDMPSRIGLSLQDYAKILAAIN